MESMPLHPAIVHFPLGVALVLPLVALGIALAIWRGWLSRGAWWVVVGLTVALTASAVVALQTGEREEHRVKPVVPKAAVQTHEHRAQAFAWAAGALAALALGAAFLRGRWQPPAMLVVVAATALVAGLGLWTGHSGGTLVYRHGAAAAYGPGATPAAPPAQSLPRERDAHRD